MEEKVHLLVETVLVFGMFERERSWRKLPAAWCLGIDRYYPRGLGAPPRYRNHSTIGEYPHMFCWQCCLVRKSASGILRDFWKWAEQQGFKPLIDQVPFLQSNRRLRWLKLQCLQMSKTYVVMVVTVKCETTTGYITVGTDNVSKIFLLWCLLSAESQQM